MIGLLQDLDRVLRGEFTRPDDLARGRVGMSGVRLLTGSLLLGVTYGACMGLFGVLRAQGPSWEQLVATSIKVPLLFLLTLLVTYPSLYVFSALAGSRLQFGHTLRLLLAAIAVNSIVLASFGPVTGFFTLSTTSYPFMVLLNVLFFAIAGIVGVAFLRKALGAIFVQAVPSEPATPAQAPETEQSDASPAAGASSPQPGYASGVPQYAPRDPARGVFRIWIVIYGVVGAQMGWILRPFVGDPDLPFEILRERESNFFEAVVRAIAALFS